MEELNEAIVQATESKVNQFRPPAHVVWLETNRTPFDQSFTAQLTCKMCMVRHKKTLTCVGTN